MKQTEPQKADLEVVFRECARDLGIYFARRHGGVVAVDDLVQESFLQLARRFRTRQVGPSPRAYLFGIARNISRAFFRRQRNVAEPLDAASQQASTVEPDARLMALREMIAMMPALQREILDLRFAHALSYAEIATALNIPVGTVRSRLHNAVTLLRERLETEAADSLPNNP